MSIIFQTVSKAVKILKACRFMACGSAALPDTIMKDWEQLTGNLCIIYVLFWCILCVFCMLYDIDKNVNIIKTFGWINC